MLSSSAKAVGKRLDSQDTSCVAERAQNQEKKMNAQFRVEADSMGEMRVPSDALYGAQTQRAVENFPISNLRFSREFIRAMGLIKLAAARANMDLGLLDKKVGTAIVNAAQEVIDGKLDQHFVLDIFQTGSGT